MQLSLFDAPKPVKLTHDWMVRPLGPNECASCLLLWFSGASRGETVAFLTEVCPVKVPDSPQQPPVFVYLGLEAS